MAVSHHEAIHVHSPRSPTSRLVPLPSPLLNHHLFFKVLMRVRPSPASASHTCSAKASKVHHADGANVKTLELELHARSYSTCNPPVKFTIDRQYISPPPPSIHCFWPPLSPPLDRNAHLSNDRMLFAVDLQCRPLCVCSVQSLPNAHGQQSSLRETSTLQK